MEPITYSLSDEERNALSAACSDPRFDAAQADDQDHLVAIATEVAATLDGGLRAQVEPLVADPATPDLLLIHELPRVREPKRLIATVGSLFGPVVKYPGEGDYIIEIREDLSRMGSRPSFANAREFFPHTDLSYVPDPPPFFAMHSVVNDPAEGGFSEFCDVGEITASLPKAAVEELEQSQFLFPAPPHFEGATSVQFPVLMREKRSGRRLARFRRDNLRARTREGIEAVIDFVKAVESTMAEVSLTANSMAIIGNRTVLHGRTAFVSSEQVEQGRHLNRMYIGAPATSDG